MALRRILAEVALVAVLVALPVTVACSSDGGGDSTSTTVTGSGGDSTDGAGGSQAVEQYCADTAEVAAALEEAISNPGGGEDVFAITERAAQLSEQAAALSEANPDQAARITECVNQLTVAPEVGG